MSIIRRLLIVLSLFSCLLVLIPQVLSAETILISGSTTVEKFMKRSADVYMLTHPGIRFNIQGGGSTAGFARVVTGRAHIGMMSRELTAREQQDLGDIRHVAVAVDAVVGVVSQEIYDAGVRSISREALAGIYRGQIDNWQRLGGPDRQIISVDENLYHGTRKIFSAYIGMNSTMESSATVVLDSMDDIVRLIRSSDQAIGYVGYGYLGQGVKALSLDIEGRKVAATPANIAGGAYPLSRKLYLLVSGKAPPWVQDFLQFILSPEGQQIAREAGFLSIK